MRSTRQLRPRSPHTSNNTCLWNSGFVTLDHKLTRPAGLRNVAQSPTGTQIVPSGNRFLATTPVYRGRSRALAATATKISAFGFAHHCVGSASSGSENLDLEVKGVGLAWRYSLGSNRAVSLALTAHVPSACEGQVVPHRRALPVRPTTLATSRQSMIPDTAAATHVDTSRCAGSRRRRTSITSAFRRGDSPSTCVQRGEPSSYESTIDR